MHFRASGPTCPVGTQLAFGHIGFDPLLTNVEVYTMSRSVLAALLLSGMLVAVGCDIEQTEPGRAPDVDVQVDPGKVPEYDVDAPDVDVNAEKRKVNVPDVDVDVNKKETEISVPDIDITPANEDTNDN